MIKTSSIAIAVWTTLLFSVLIQTESAELSVKIAMGQINPTTASFATYNGSKYGISVMYPSNWKITEDASGVWFISPVDETGNVRIESQSTHNASLAELVQAQFLQSKSSYKELNISSSNLTTIAGNPANRTDYRFKEEVPKFFGSDIYETSAIQISTVKGDRLYTVIYFSNPDNFYLFLPIVQKMITTLRIL